MSRGFKSNLALWVIGGLGIGASVASADTISTFAVSGTLDGGYSAGVYHNDPSDVLGGTITIDTTLGTVTGVAITLTSPDRSVTSSLFNSIKSNDVQDAQYGFGTIILKTASSTYPTFSLLLADGTSLQNYAGGTILSDTTAISSKNYGRFVSGVFFAAGALEPADIDEVYGGTVTPLAPAAVPAPKAGLASLVLLCGVAGLSKLRK